MVLLQVVQDAVREEIAGQNGAPLGSSTSRKPTATSILRQQKLFGLLGGVDGAGATVELFSRLGLAGVLEVFGGLLVVLGLLTRPVAALLVLEMLAAYGIAHLPQGGFPIQNGGELPLLYALVFLFLAASGAGPASLDQMMAKRRAGWNKLSR